MNYKEGLLEIVSSWTVDQLKTYIERLEGRIKDTQVIITELKVVLKRKQPKKPVDTGPRAGGG